jgi:hypothetical protein
MLKLKELL